MHHDTSQLFSIGEMAKLYQINVQTLRYYDAIGLFSPALRSSQTGYRYYSVDQFEELNTIRYLRRLGVSIEEIQSIMKERNLEGILHVFQKQYRQVQTQIAELKRVEKNIKTRMEQITQAAQNGVNVDGIVEKELPSRRAAILKRPIQSGDSLEMPIRLLEKAANLQDSIFLGKIALSISKEELLHRNYNAYHAILLLLEDTDESEMTLSSLPGGLYLSLLYHGTHDKAEIYYDKLLDYCEQKRYQILDDSVEITYIDYGLTSRTEDFLTEIQIRCHRQESS